MPNDEYRVTYPITGRNPNITAKAKRGQPLVTVDGPVVLVEDETYDYCGPAGVSLQAGDLKVYYDAGVPIDAEYHLEEVSVDMSAITSDLTVIDAEMSDLLVALTPVTSLPLPAISIDTIKTILRLTDSEYDDQLTVLIPIIEDVVVNYCGISAISDLSVGAIFPIAGLVRYAMENPIGAKSQTVGSDRTEYGEFPNALLKLLDNFKPDTSGGYANAEVINLNDVNEDLGI